MLSRLYGWYGKTVVNGALGVIGALLVAGITVSILSSGDSTSAPAAATQVVRTAPIGALMSNSHTVSVIGTVEAISEAEVRSEVSGQITAVPVSIGDRVAAGTVLATFENARERASVLQAEGAYEAAQASAAQSNISVNTSADNVAQARLSAWNEYRSAFIAVDNILRNTYDPLFSGHSQQLLGLREFTDERRAIRYDVEDWGDTSLAPIPEEDLAPYLADAQVLVSRLTTFTDDIYAQLLTKDGSNEHEATRELAEEYKVTLNTVRTTLNATYQALETDKANLESTQDAFARARLSGTGGEVSAADASLKQALGALRSAQAALEQTIVRSPISGVVNSVYVKRGAYVSAATPVAMVINSGALEITAYLSETDRTRVATGDTVTLEHGSTGRITKIAPAVDRTTQKYEIKISPNTDTLEAGDVVRIALDTEIDITSTDQPIMLPLTAVKLMSDRALVFTVEKNVLVAHEVTLGDVRGNAIVITSGVTPALEIVVDARGLTEGSTVRVVE